MSEQLNSVEEDGRIQGSNNSALQQQVQDMTSLLATEQEKALTLLKDKKEFIKQKHVHLKVLTEGVVTRGLLLQEGCYYGRVAAAGGLLLKEDCC